MDNIFILDGQTDEVLGHINKKYVIDNEHERDLPTHKDYFRFTVLADNKHAEHLTKRNGLIVPGEDGELLEFRIFESIKYRDNEGLKIEVHALATYLDLKNQKVFDPQKTSSETALQHANLALAGTEWQIGEIDFKGIRTLTFDNPFNSYDYILRIAREFELEPCFYIETDGNKVTGRYVDLVEQIGEFRGRTIEFGRDLQRIERKEDTSEVVTALWIYGPEREDGTRLKVFVEDDDARQRWGRKGKHIVDYYEPETENDDITEARLRTLGEMELRKRINAIVTYEAEILDLENIPGLENKKIRFGDIIRIKDVYFNPALYVEARVFNVKRDVFNKAKKTVQLGDYVEYTEEEVKALFRQMQAEIRRRLERLALVSIISSAGNVFKNAQGETELTARTFVSGAERDEDGTLYDYQWMRFDKDGNHDTNFYAEGKTITVKASDIDEKATYRVLVAYELEVINTAELTISNVFDGEDGEQGPPGEQGPKGEDGKTFYTWIKYADTPTSGMSDSPEGKEYIGIAYNKETPTPSTNYADYVWSKFKGEQGIPGPPGEDGQPTYTWVKYADDEHGNGMSDSPDGKLYIGLAFNRTTPTESTNPNDYTWSLMPQNIEIGGRNLLRNSDFSSGKDFWSGKFSIDGNEAVLQSTVGSSHPIQNTTEIPEGEYVAQIRYKVIEGQAPYLFATKGIDMTILEGSHSFDVADNDWNTHTVKVRVKSKSRFFAIRYASSSPVDHLEGKTIISWVKLEKGTVATDWTPAPEDVQAEINEAKQEAEEAKQEAQQAQTTADGKNTVFRQSSQPTTSGRKIGDVWFDTSKDNLMHVFNGSSWVQAKWGEQSIVANSITANHIKSLVGLNVNDQFVVDSQGNAKFAGNLEGASGTFGKVSVVDGDMTLIDNTTGSETILNTGSNFLFDHSFEFIKPNVALEPVDPNNPYLASICSVDADSLTSYYGGWNNTKPSNARMVRAFDAESKHIYSGLNAIILRGQDYGTWDQICFIPEHVRQTNALSFSAYVAPFEKTTYNVIISLRIQLVNENGAWVQDLASNSYLIDHTKKYNWQRVSVTYKGNLNIGKNRLRVRLLLNNNTSSAMLLCDGAQLVPFKNPTLYEPESSFFHFLNGIGKAYLISTQYISSDSAGVHNLWAGSIEPHTHSTLSLINGWQNYGGSFVRAAYTKTADGYVHLRGLIQNGAIGTVCGTLPVGCRPYGTELFAVNAGDGHFARITINSSGNVTVTSATSSSPPFISLSGISFRAEN